MCGSITARAGRAHRQLGALLVLLVLGVPAVLVLCASEAGAVVVGASPRWPIPSDPAAAPPPLPALPAATAARPSASEIGDPVTPAASCGDWSLQTSYGDRWQTDSEWWEFSCWYYDGHCTGMCNANTTPDIYTDYFYWDGFRAVFYGEFYGAYYWSSYYWPFADPDLFGEYWWDAPTSAWYKLPPAEEPEPNSWPTAVAGVTCSGSSCDFDGAASSDSDGTIASYDWVYGDRTSGSGVVVHHTYAEPGTFTATLTVTDNQGGWARDSKLVIIESAPPPNTAPTASLSVSCAGLNCTLDGGGSADSDGTIVQYRWEFGDGSGGAGKTAKHSYAQTGGYTVRLTVTDDDGASDSAASQVIPITDLTALGHKLKAQQKVDLRWSGSSGTSYDVYRDGVRLTTVSSTTYTDNLNRKGSGSYSYKVCQTGGTICSNQAAVTF